MEEVWREDRATVRSVMEVLNNRRAKARAYTTYMTVMVGLARKGLLERKRTGKADTYWPLFSYVEFRQARAKHEVSELIDAFGEIAFVHFAREMDKLDPARVKQLQRLARDA
jgi:predicted transcriptional regulator